MSAQSFAQAEGLRVAKYLVDCGVPVFIAEPAREHGLWQPDGGHNGCGYWLPKDWEQAAPDVNAIARWRPGQALCALMGNVVDGADIDPRHGGSETMSGLQAAGMWPRSFGRAETPSGGSHDLIAALAVGSKDNLRPGLDVKGGKPDGESRGFLFIAPTVRKSKVDGRVRAYRWTVEPDLDDLVVEGLVDESGMALAAMVEASRPATTARPAAGSPWAAIADPHNDHEGPIRIGERDTSLRDYVWMLVNRYPHHTEAELEALVERRWRDCEQRPGEPYPLQTALAMLPRALGKVPREPGDPSGEENQNSYLDRLVSDEVRKLRVRDLARDAYASEQDAADADDLDALFLDRAGLAGMVVPPMLIAGVLPAGSNAILRGRDQSFKSFLALDWSLHIATGINWQGRGVEQGRVLYVAGEGAFGLGKRVDAWEAEHDTRVDPASFVVRRAGLDLHRAGTASAHLLRYVEDGKFSLVVVDTLRRVSGGADGNSSEMGAVVDNIDRLKVATRGGSTLTVAHTGKSDDDVRGFSGIEDDADVVWHAARPEGSSQVVLKHTKMKDGEELKPVTLDAVKVLDSLVLRPPGRTETGPSHEWQVLDWVANGTDALEVTASMVVKGTGLKRDTAYRWLRKLVESGRLDQVGTATRPKYRVAS